MPRRGEYVFRKLTQGGARYARLLSRPTHRTLLFPSASSLGWLVEHLWCAGAPRREFRTRSSRAQALSLLLPMFRKVILVFLALAFCGLVVVGIDLARRWKAADRLERAGVGLDQWHYRFSGADVPAASWNGDPGNWHRMIASPGRAVLAFPVRGREQIVMDRSILRDLALLGVEHIELFECRGLTPAVMSELARNSSVRTLVVTVGDATNEGVNLLWSGCPNLTKVQFIMPTDIGDDAFRSVKAARELKVVNLWGVDITNQTMVYLREAPHLEELVLSTVGVGEECGPLLATMPQLRRVELHDVKAAVVIRGKLRALRPDITVITNPRELRDGQSEIGGNVRSP
jgi:hypothetical protein